MQRPVEIDSGPQDLRARGPTYPQKWRPGFLIKAQPKCTWNGRGAIQDIQKALQVTLPPELMNGAIRTSFISSKTQNGSAPRCLDKTSQSTWPWEWNTVIESIWCQTQQRLYAAYQPLMYICPPPVCCRIPIRSLDEKKKTMDGISTAYKLSMKLTW